MKKKDRERIEKSDLKIPKSEKDEDEENEITLLSNLEETLKKVVKPPKEDPPMDEPPKNNNEFNLKNTALSGIVTGLTFFGVTFFTDRLSSIDLQEEIDDE